MKIVSRIILLAILGGLGFWLWTVLFPSPKKIVLKKMARLAAVATVNANDSNLTRAGKAVSLADSFAPNAQIIINIPNLINRTVSGREEIKTSAMGGFTQINSMKVEFFDTTAKVGPDRKTADVSCTLRISAEGQKDYGVQELRFRFEKLDGDWLITHVETVQTLQ